MSILGQVQDRLFYKNDIVEGLVVVVIEIHYASLKWMLQMNRVYLLLAVLVKSLGHHNSPFNEVSSVDYIFSVQFAAFLEVWKSFHLTHNLILLPCLYVGVSLTILDCVPKLLAAHTPALLLQPLVLIVIHPFVLIVRVFFALVLAVLAAWRVFVLFSAAPPHLPTPIRLMGSARPIEVFFLFELLVALFAGFYLSIIVALPSHDLLYS